ncbi:type II secretion system F family protein [Enterobacter sp. 22325]|uniref:type II secretion system F family protein n=1 Tax=Enterobacter sp. 22325 TaxID=3453911 RepID=UPI003F8585CE
MTYTLSTLLFIAGCIVFLVILKKQKKEEEYYDRFYFIVSNHESINEYLKLKNRIKAQFVELQIGIYNLTEKYLSNTEYNRLVINAGFYRMEERSAYYIMVLSLYILLLIIMSAFLILDKVEAIIMPLATVLYFFATKIYLERRHKEELRMYRANFVYFLDLMSTCVQTGMTLTASLDTVSHMLYRFSRLLSISIQNFNRSIKYSTLEEACERLYRDVPISEVSEFTSTVKNSAQFGAGMHASLQELATEIRKFHFIETEEKIGLVNAKMGIPLILFIMFPIIVEIIAPGLLRVMEGMAMDNLS